MQAEPATAPGRPARGAGVAGSARATRSKGVAVRANPPFPPRLFLIGAQKCATTFLADCLAAHPEIALATPKEPDFFTRNHARGAHWYRACFPDPAPRVLLDASVSYAAAPLAAETGNPLCGVPERIRATSPEARFVYLVRDPVQRVHSAYWHAVTAGHERRPFRQAIVEDPWYLNVSRFHRQLSCYLDVFPLDRLLLLDMRATIADAAEAVDRVCRHVGLAPAAALDLPGGKRNAGYRLNAIGRVLAAGGLRRSGLARVNGFARGVLPVGLYDRVRGAVTRSLPEMTPADRGYVADQLADDTARFTALTGFSFDPAQTSPSPPPGPPLGPPLGPDDDPQVAAGAGR